MADSGCSKDDENQDKEMQIDDQSSSSSDEDDNENENELLQKVTTFKDQLKISKYYYDAHVGLIDALRKLGDLEELRAAREDMAQVYPLAPELWMAWLKDEQKICTEAVERKIVEELFDRAVKDYTSVKIWVEYIMFMLGGGDIDSTRTVCDRALIAVGTHVAEGMLVWQAVQLFEQQVFQNLQTPLGQTATAEQQKVQADQLKHIQQLYRRQLRVPLLNMEETKEEAKPWFDGQLEKQMELDFEKSKKKLKDKLAFENELIKCDKVEDKLEIYQRYVASVIKNDNPAAVQSIYERAVTDLCLYAQLWIEYVQFVSQQFGSADYVVLPVCERSQRNCPWSADLCELHMTAVQEFAEVLGPKETQKRVKGALEISLNGGMTSGLDLTRIWMGYLVYLRRQVVWSEPHEEAIEVLRDTANDAVNVIDKYFGEEGDIESVIGRYIARVEAELEKNMEGARQVWNDIILKRNNNFKNAWLWLEFINLERSYGTIKHTRKLFRRALERVWDQVEVIADAYEKFEKEVGTVETLKEFKHKRKARMEIVAKKRQEDAVKQEEEQKAQQRKKGKKILQGKKQNFTPEVKQTEDVFKAPLPVQPKSPRSLKGAKGGVVPPGSKKDVSSPPGFRKDLSPPPPGFKDTASPPGFKGELTPPPGFKRNMSPPPPGFKDTAPPPGFKGGMTPPPGFKGDVAPPPGFKSDVSPPPGFKTNEDLSPGFREDLSASGHKKDSRKRPSDFEEDEPQAKRHKEMKHGEFVNHDESINPRSVFLSNLSYSTTEDEILPIFSSCGNVDTVRLARDYKGRSKGFGYLIFENEEAVPRAIEKDRSPINGRPVFVSKCDPENRGYRFKYSTGLEKNKLFVRGLPFSLNEEQVKQIFEKQESVKAIRLVTHRNGYSKGNCYIEYENERCATKVKENMDGTELHGHKISVFFSDPSNKRGETSQAGKRNDENEGSSQVKNVDAADDIQPPDAVVEDGKGTSGSRIGVVSGSDEGRGSRRVGGRGGGRGGMGGVRGGHQRLALSLVPRSLLRGSVGTRTSGAQEVKNGEAAGNGDGPEKPKSNADFRKMLLNK